MIQGNATVPAPPSWWSSLEDMLHFSRRQSRVYWRAICQSTHPAVIALRYRCDSFEHQPFVSAAEDRRQREAFITHVWTPHRLITSLEHLHSEHLLTRREGTALAELFLRYTDRDGHWRMR